jgi:hypothetical protein
MILYIKYLKIYLKILGLIKTFSKVVVRKKSTHKNQYLFYITITGRQRNQEKNSLHYSFSKIKYLGIN